MAWCYQHDCPDDLCHHAHPDPRDKQIVELKSHLAALISAAEQLDPTLREIAFFVPTTTQIDDRLRVVNLDVVFDLKHKAAGIRQALAAAVAKAKEVIK